MSVALAEPQRVVSARVPIWRVLPLPGRAAPLRVAFAEPAGTPRGTLLVLPGRAEFLEKYDEAIADLCGLGFAVAVLEWRGQGLSRRDGPFRQRGHIEDFDDYLEDLADALRALDDVRAPEPRLMLGHSMGGHVGLRWLHHEPARFAAAAMTAPMFGIAQIKVPEPVARLLVRAGVRVGARLRYAPGQRDFHIARCRFEGNPLTGCPIRFARFASLLETRPELALGGVTWGWLDASLRSIAVTRRPGFAERITTPILLCQAAEERIVCNRAIERFAARLPAARLCRFPGRHELLLERDPIRAAVVAEIERFFRETAGV